MNDGSKLKDGWVVEVLLRHRANGKTGEPFIESRSSYDLLPEAVMAFENATDGKIPPTVIRLLNGTSEEKK